ncbi:transglycosylase SLT domain-containing protein [Cyanobacterium aponinum UTEX 3222]|uniref:lytic transglycosylase domain-containing protein n=1 Tax=Cyanobacterium aponinum TaxID=379064 RepID=UPI00309270B8|nr:transglycosylase SLT domain-containing protein [Cyanobacterium aponinum UTEX 3222]
MKTDKSKKNQVIIQIVVILAVCVAGATFFTPKLLEILNSVLISPFEKKPEYRLDAPSEVLPLANLPPSERKASLEVIANKDTSSLDVNRAKYLLAVDALRNDFDGAKALQYLENLDRTYPILAPYVLLLQGRAYELNNNTEKAQKIWQDVINKYPDELVSAQAYYKLGNYDPKFFQEAINRFPQHPRTHDIAIKLLEENPQQKELLLLLAEYDIVPENKARVDRLVKEYSQELEPKQWDIVGNYYWETGNYNLVSFAYEKGTSTPQNLYRIARSYQVSDKEKEAKTAYFKLVETYPDAPETGLAWRRLATMSGGEEALSFLNRVDEKYPDEVVIALREKATLLTQLGRYQEATNVRDTILQKYPQSEEAADYRWQIAKDFADSGDYVSAWQWAQQISVNNPDSGVAPKAGFWIGKWAEKLGQNQEATKAYEYVLQNHPHSYYAWRSAVRLGKDVGDFNNLRSLPLQVEIPQQRPIPPAGSNQFKELFLLGEDQDAIDLFTAEIGKKSSSTDTLPVVTVSEQFVQGLLKQNQGKYLESINLIWNLKNRDNPEDIGEWQILRRSPEYWYALFPFPYEELIVKWSKERNLNPFLVVSLMRQESRFEKDIKSPVGATGLMQIMPETGAWIAPQINIKEYSLTDPEDNIKMGTWYLNYTHNTYNDNSMLAIASYNAGPGNVSNWISRYSLADIDEFVENIPFRETKNYIETVFGNYWNYVELYDPKIEEKLN